MGYDGNLIGWAVIGLVCGVTMFATAIIAAFAIYTHREEWREEGERIVVPIILCVMSGIAIFGAFFPTNIEQHTEVVTIDHFENRSPLGVGKDNYVAFVINGEENWVKIEDGQRDMYEMLIGKEVELTYGKVNRLFWNPAFEDGEWLFVGIKLIEGES